MGTAITALLELLKQFLCVKQTDMENRPVLDAIRDKRNLKKATDIMEKVLLIADKYTEQFDKKDLKQYNKLKNRFLKFN